MLSIILLIIHTLYGSNVERVVRERFGKAVARGVGDLKITRATHSPISGVIDSAVIEVSSLFLSFFFFLKKIANM